MEKLDAIYEAVIRIDENVKNMQDKAIDHESRIRFLEQEKESKKTVASHEIRINRMEQTIAKAIGAGSLLLIIFTAINIIANIWSKI